MKNRIELEKRELELSKALERLLSRTRKFQTKKTKKKTKKEMKRFRRQRSKRQFYMHFARFRRSSSFFLNPSFPPPQSNLAGKTSQLDPSSFTDSPSISNFSPSLSEWKRDLTAEGIEPHPGPPKASVGPTSRVSIAALQQQSPTSGTLPSDCSGTDSGEADQDQAEEAGDDQAQPQSTPVAIDGATVAVPVLLDGGAVLDLQPPFFLFPIINKSLPRYAASRHHFTSASRSYMILQSRV